MRRLARRLLNALAVLSLLLSMATVALWVRSYRAVTEIDWWSAHPNNRQWCLAVAIEPGCLLWSSESREAATVPRELRDRYMLPPGLHAHLRDPIGAAVTFDRWEQRWGPTGAAWRRFGIGVRWRDRRSNPDFTSTDIVLSLGWLALGFAALPVLRGLRRTTARTRQRNRRSRGLCSHCSYDLTGNVSGVCPECGTEVMKGTK